MSDEKSESRMPRKPIRAKNQNTDDGDSTMVKLFIDVDGFVTFPDGAKYKGGLDQGVPDGEGTIIYVDGSEYDGEWR